jgi:hypothetical protein
MKACDGVSRLGALIAAAVLAGCGSDPEPPAAVDESQGT